MGPLTIQQAKDKAAQKLGFNDYWALKIKTIDSIKSSDTDIDCISRAMQIYAESQNQELAGKYYEACTKIEKLEKSLDYFITLSEPLLIPGSSANVLQDAIYKAKQLLKP